MSSNSRWKSKGASAICPKLRPFIRRWRRPNICDFVGKLKGLSGADLQKRVDYVCGRCAVADVKNKLLGKLSKGYRQRVGLAQAIIHNPDVLILDEPTAGLDPKQINETRDLIKGLAGDHTIILSTHILPEVEQTCEQVIIINKGKLVATDSVRNLQSARARRRICVARSRRPRWTARSSASCSRSWSRLPASAACCASEQRRQPGRCLKWKARRDGWFAATWRAPSSNLAGISMSFVPPP